MYATKAEIARMFKVSSPTVYSRVEGIKKEIGKRYNKYAILDNMISIAVYIDYEKYKKMLADKNLRKYVPEFDKSAAEQYISKTKSKKADKVKETIEMIKTEQIDAILILRTDNEEMNKLIDYLKKELDAH